MPKTHTFVLQRIISLFNLVAAMSRIVYYLLLKPLSRLPLSVLYHLSDLLFLLIYRLAGYRNKVVFTNLRNSFPEKSEQEIRSIADRFYRHFCDLIVESIRLFSMPVDEARTRLKVRNPDLLQGFYEEGRSVLLIAGHYCNWELSAAVVDLMIPHQSVGIYAPLANPFFNEVISRSRSRFGLELVPRKIVKQWFRENQDRLTAVFIAIDQSPPTSTNAYWTYFLNQDTAVLFGTEYYAKKYNIPIIFSDIQQRKRGYYEVTFEVLEADPVNTDHGVISERHTRRLERQILANPDY